MKTLVSENIYLRALEPTDLDFLYQLENDESLWEVSNTSVPFSKFILSQYLENAHKDIFTTKQLRLVVCLVKDKTAIGCIDLFDFDPQHKRVGVGIVIFSEKNKQQGFAYESLKLLCNYAFTHLAMHQIHATITEDNTASIQLFEKACFVKTGIKKDWIFSKGIYKNEIQYQLIHD